MVQKFPPMKRWARRLWIVALESGKYVPGYGRLRQRNFSTQVTSYCPLGVLCQVMPRVEFKRQNARTEEDMYVYKHKDVVDYAPTKGSYVPDNLAAEIGLSNFAQFTVANLSDGGMSHKEIAQWLRKNL